MGVTSIEQDQPVPVEKDRQLSLRQAQEYLQRFGYLRLTESRETAAGEGVEPDGIDIDIDAPLKLLAPLALAGEHDAATGEALRRFQRFAHIPVTGEVDAQTRVAMGRKRCGMADVGEFTTGHGDWDTHELTYSFQNYTPDVPRSEILWAIDQAFGMWSGVTPLRFRRVADGTGGNIVIRFVSGAHGDSNPFDGPGNILAHAFYPSNGGAIRGDTHFDEAETWRVDLPITSGFDLVAVAAHEFGHAIGLGHSDVDGALMQPFYGGPQRRLGTDDVAGVSTLYRGTGLENATWVHGNAAVVELPDRVQYHRAFGFYNRIIGVPETTNWIHFALPTPVIEDGQRLVLDRFMLRAITGENAVLRDVHIRDGERVVALHNGVNVSGTLPFEIFGVASMPSVQWGVSVSLGFTFGGGESASRQVDLISAGFDYQA